MKLFIYDMEVFAYDWLAVFKDTADGEYTIIHNDPDAVREFISDDAVYCGFNSKFYDQYIVKAICSGLSPEEVKEVNDFIIGGGLGWEAPLLRGVYHRFNNIDIRDDMQMGLSLKAIEGHLGLSVEETAVPFDIDRPLTPEELQETIRYCKHDVDTTERLVEIRKEYLKSKMFVGQMVGLPDEKSLSMTNAKLTSALLGATPQEYGDERNYSYPPNLALEFIPKEVTDFFDQMHDPSISDTDLFKGKLEIKVGGCPCVIAYGGIHAAIPCYSEEATGTRTIRNYDVASLYPSLMINCGYTSRSIPSADGFKEVYQRRMAAKNSGDKATSDALKLVLNTTYGAMLNKYNDLFDPRMGRSVCVSGQLFILELAQRYVKHLKTVKIIQLNTDGIMISIDESELSQLTSLNDEWQERTGFVLEEDVLKKIVQKDVNNYVEIKANGKTKAKGGYVVRGIPPAGAFNINNNATIVAKAIMDYFVNGTPVEKTISECSDIMEFQLIAKAGVKYREAYHLVDGVKNPVQKVNRVYATSDTRYGKVFKVKAEDDATAKIESLPDHCIIDNDNRLTIGDVDKSFYIQLATKRINDFLGIKPERKRRTKKMATTKTQEKSTPMNVYQRLALARKMFLEAGVSKTGKNMHLKFVYFELDDIVPVAIPIFGEVGLLPIVTFDNEVAKMTIVNIDTPEETIIFTSPMRMLDGNAAMNALQSLGASETYQRRYLYNIALDICEPDHIDGGLGSPAPASAPKPPATPETREEVKNQLTNSEGAASSLQIKQLKNALKLLKEKDPSKEEMIATIAVQTKGFTEISKSDCEKIITRVSEMIAGTEG